MMRLHLKRQESQRGATPGDLFIDDSWACHTLEDEVREVSGQPVASWKVAGKTAIPRGEYPLVIDWSNRFQKYLPRLLDVEGFTGIRIHAGNTTAHTDGCILVGLARTNNIPDFLGDSRRAMALLIPRLATALDAGQVITMRVE